MKNLMKMLGSRRPVACCRHNNSDISCTIKEKVVLLWPKEIFDYIIMRKIALYLIILYTGMTLVSCSQSGKRYKIGVSQCSEDIWREKQNAELRMGAYLHEDVELRFAAAYDSDERQVQQIDSLVSTGIDLLIVAPNQVQTISPAIDRAFDKGIPVIVFERKTNSQKYTAFISADNYEMGRTMGEYVAARLDGRGTVLEIKGLEGSSPAIERHNGFMEALRSAPGIKVVASLQGDWTEPVAYETTKQWLAQHGDVHVDLVFGANDRTAMGARKALGDGVLYCGVDGLPGEGGGIQLVRDSILEATYIYPTHGDRLLQLAVDILDGKPYEKETRLMSALVTGANAKVLLMQSEEILRQTLYLDQLHEKADNYMQALGTQRLLTWLLALIVVLVTLSALFIVSSMRRRHRLERQAFSMVVNVPQSEALPVSPEKPDHEASIPDSRHQAITDVTPEEQNRLEAEANADARFLEQLRSLVQEQMGDSGFSVEVLATQMGVSRVQLYRKVKTLTGRTPVDIIRLSRLNRSKVLLQTSGLTVSEVAYQTGFSSPSYFTKCFKEEFGQLPGDSRA